MKNQADVVDSLWKKLNVNRFWISCHYIDNMWRPSFDHYEESERETLQKWWWTALSSGMISIPNKADNYSLLSSAEPAVLADYHEITNNYLKGKIPLLFLLCWFSLILSMHDFFILYGKLAYKLLWIA